MPNPIPQNVSPNIADPGDRFTVVITGDVLTGVQECSFGVGIVADHPTVVGDHELRVKIVVSSDANPGKRDVSVTNASGETGMLTLGFEVR